jgi:hypothetical protein
MALTGLGVAVRMIARRDVPRRKPSKSPRALNDASGLAAQRHKSAISCYHETPDNLKVAGNCDPKGPT